MHAVRVEVRRMGGGFGGKESQGNALAVACALAARATGRPCPMRYDRDDDIMITGKRHDFRIDYRVGVDAEGRILGSISATTPAAAGRWTCRCRSPTARCCMPTTPISCRRADRVATGCDQHPVATAFRGFGGPQGMLGMERVMDHIAHTLRLDPLACAAPISTAPPRPAKDRPRHRPPLRRRTAPRRDPGPQTTPYGQPVEDFILHEMVATAGRQRRLRRPPRTVAAWNAANPVLKRGWR
jgi:xanthine dehydrogenase large subunit